MHVTSDHTHEFDEPPDELWRELTRTDQYRAWWPWLRSLDATSGVRAGARWRCAVRSPLGYTVRFEVAIESVDPHRAIDASVTGDIAGTARIALAPDGSGSALRLTTRLTPARPALRRLARVAPPVVRWGHDRVLRSGIDRFRRRGDTGQGRSGQGRAGRIPSGR